MHEIVRVRSVSEAGLLQALGGGVRASEAMHAEFHKDTRRAVIVAQHLADGHVFFNCHENDPPLRWGAKRPIGIIHHLWA